MADQAAGHRDAMARRDAERDKRDIASAEHIRSFTGAADTARRETATAREEVRALQAQIKRQQEQATRDGETIRKQQATISRRSEVAFSDSASTVVGPMIGLDTPAPVPTHPIIAARPRSSSVTVPPSPDMGVSLIPQGLAPIPPEMLAGTARAHPERIEISVMPALEHPGIGDEDDDYGVDPQPEMVDLTAGDLAKPLIESVTGEDGIIMKQEPVTVVAPVLDAPIDPGPMRPARIGRVVGEEEGKMAEVEASDKEKLEDQVVETLSRKLSIADQDILLQHQHTPQNVWAQLPALKYLWDNQPQEGDALILAIIERAPKPLTGRNLVSQQAWRKTISELLMSTRGQKFLHGAPAFVAPRRTRCTGVSRQRHKANTET